MIKIQNTFAPAIAAAMLALGAVACDKSPEKAQQEANEAQRQADLKAAQAYDNADKTAAQAQQNADSKINQANATLTQAQQDLANKTEEKLGKIDTRIIEVRGKIAKSTNTTRPRAELNKRVDDLVAQLGQARTTLAEAKRTTDANAFSGTKDKLENEVAAIDTALSSLEKDV